MGIQMKRINRTTYLWNEAANLIGEIKGPYSPGSVWKLEVYKPNDQFAEAWRTERLTPVQRGECSVEKDRVIAAMCFGQTNALSPDIIEGHSECIGYLYKTKRAAVAAFDETCSERMV